MLLFYCRFPALRSPFWQVLKIRFITHSEEDKGSSAAQCSPVHTARRKSSKKNLHVNPLAPNLCFTHIVRTFSFLKSFQRLSRGLKKTRNMTRKFRLNAWSRLSSQAHTVKITPTGRGQAKFLTGICGATIISKKIMEAFLHQLEYLSYIYLKKEYLHRHKIYVCFG